MGCRTAARLSSAAGGNHEMAGSIENLRRDAGDSRLVRHVIVTVILGTTAVVVAWVVLFTGPGMGDNRYPPGRVFSTGVGGPAMQTAAKPATRVGSIQQDPLPTGVTHAQYRRNTSVPR